jgi:hypothetical protein
MGSKEGESIVSATPEASRGNFDERAAQFVVEITDPDSPNFGNALGSAVSAMDVTYETAHKQSYKLLRQDRIRNEIERILEERGMGKEHRSSVLIELITQKMTRKTERYNAEGELVEVVKSGPTFSDIIKAVDTLNRMDGTYSDQKKVSDQERDVHRLLIKEVMKEARDRAKGKKVIGELSIDAEVITDQPNLD